MNIEGLSEATLEKWIARGFLKDFGDIFEISRYREEITTMEGFGEKSYENLIQSIDRARHTTLPRLLYALGIPNIGVANAKMICRSFQNNLEKIRSATEEELQDIEGVGAVIARAFAEYFRKEENQKKLDHLLAHVELEEQQEEEAQIFEGRNFVITGSVVHFANRSELKEEIEKRGGRVTGSVSSKTDYLINNDAGSASSKNKKAAQLGVMVITEEEFLKMLQK